MANTPIVYKLMEVSKSYYLGSIEVAALKDVSLEVVKGKFVAIVGPSGSGKSTLLNIMGLLTKPTKGRVFFEGRDVSNLSDREASYIRSRRIGFVFQMFNLVPWLSALENVELALSIAGASRKEARGRAEELLKLVGLGSRMHHRPSELSGGEQQRVGLARALANSPSVLLADEPTGTLDSVTGAQISEILKNLVKGGVTIVAVTHNIEFASAADTVIKLKDGRVVEIE